MTTESHSKTCRRSGGFMKTSCAFYLGGLHVTVVVLVALLIVQYEGKLLTSKAVAANLCSDLKEAVYYQVEDARLANAAQIAADRKEK